MIILLPVLHSVRAFWLIFNFQPRAANAVPGRIPAGWGHWLQGMWCLDCSCISEKKIVIIIMIPSKSPFAWIRPLFRVYWLPFRVKELNCSNIFHRGARYGNYTSVNDVIQLSELFNNPFLYFADYICDPRRHSALQQKRAAWLHREHHAHPE
jgi:hypothetical protein